MNMNQPILFSKVEFHEYIGNKHSILFLNVPECELSYQVLQEKYAAEQRCCEIVVFSRGIQLNQEEMLAIYPLCNALDYEPYRNREMSMDDAGYIGYRDEVRLYFRAVSDSPIPMIKLPMNYYYDETHIWPSEKLYRHLILKHMMHDKKAKEWVTSYGGFSLLMKPISAW